MDIIAQLKAERDKTARQVNALDTAIRALSGVNSTRGTIEPRRRISAAGRARIAAAARARWARVKGQQNVVSRLRRANASCQQPPAGRLRLLSGQDGRS